jgi:hypothetical protein
LNVGTSYEGSGASGSSIPNLHQLVPSGVDMLLEADSKDNVQPIVGGMDNLQEILAAATASLAGIYLYIKYLFFSPGENLNEQSDLGYLTTLYSNTRHYLQ